MRKLCLTPVIVAGGFWLAGAVALDYPAKTQAVDDLPGALRPAFTETGIGQANTHMALPAGALIEAGAAGAIATGRRRNVEPIEIAPSEPALVA